MTNAARLNLARLVHVALAIAVLISINSSARAADEPAKKDEPPTKEQLEKKFAALMSGAKLVGQYTTTGAKGAGTPKEEEYTLGVVKRLKEEDLWEINARIKYGTYDATVPLKLHVKWAGDTPVITLTKMEVPLFGTFSARVVIYDNHYAGYWSGGDHGGHLFGRVVPGAATPGIETPPKQPVEKIEKK